MGVEKEKMTGVVAAVISSPARSLRDKAHETRLLLRTQQR
jgi:hypothetical protein